MRFVDRFLILAERHPVKLASAMKGVILNLHPGVSCEAASSSVKINERCTKRTYQQTGETNCENISFDIITKFCF